MRGRTTPPRRAAKPSWSSSPARGAPPPRRPRAPGLPRAHPPAGGGRLHRHGQGGGSGPPPTGTSACCCAAPTSTPTPTPKSSRPAGCLPGPAWRGAFFQAAEIGVMAVLAAGDRQPQPGHPPAGGADEPPVRLHRRRRGPPAPGEPGRQRVRLPAAGGGGPAPAAPRWSRSWASTGAVAATMPSDGFLNYLYTKTGYPDMALAMEDGPQRLANLRLLEKYARDYESSGYHGVSGFCAVFWTSCGTAARICRRRSSPPRTGTRVTVMSIHKSKGLEFPVCIVAGLRPQLRPRTSGPRCCSTPSWAWGSSCGTRRARPGFTTTAREAIGLETARASAAEELRVLYVALTRAKEKLLLVGSWEDPERTAEKLALELTRGRARPLHRAPGQERRPVAAAVRPVPPRRRGPAPGCRGPGGLRLLAGTTPPGPSTSASTSPGRRPFPRKPPRPSPQTGSCTAACGSRLPLPTPTRRRWASRPRWRPPSWRRNRTGSRDITLSRPAWLGEQGMTPAERGTALHAFMQFADFAAARPRPGEGAGPPGGPGLAHPGAGGRGGFAPGAEVFGKPPGPAGAPLPPGGEGAPLHPR